MIVRGLFSVIISLPQGYEFVKRIVIHLGGLITTPAKNEDEPLTAQEERPRKPRRRRVFEIPDFTSECLLESLDGPCSETSSGQVTSDKNCLEKTTCDREQVPLNTSEWTEEDIAALTKAMNKIPSGTNERWEKIAQLLNRSFQDVTAMAKKLKSTTTSKHVSAAIQGMTANKLAKEIVNTEITKSEHFDIQKDHVTYEKVTSNNCDDYVINQTNECVQRYSTNVPQTIKTDTNEIWTQVQQRALELALAHFPRGTDERWEKIAKCVPDKSKVRILFSLRNTS